MALNLLKTFDVVIGWFLGQRWEPCFLTSDKIIDLFSILLNVFQFSYINTVWELESSIETILVPNSFLINGYMSP